MCSVCTDDRSTSGSTKDLCLTQLRKKGNCRNDFFSVAYCQCEGSDLFCGATPSLLISHIFLW